MKEIELTLKPKMYDNAAYNSQFWRPGEGIKRLPVVESSVDRIERILTGYCQRKTLTLNAGSLTMHIECEQVDENLLQRISNLIDLNVIQSAKYGDSMKNTTKPEMTMCPFCALLVEDELCEPIGYDFFGRPAKIGDVPSCDSCAQVADMSDNGSMDMLAMLKDSQSKEVSL